MWACLFKLFLYLYSYKKNNPGEVTNDLDQKGICFYQIINTTVDLKQ